MKMTITFGQVTIVIDNDDIIEQTLKQNARAIVEKFDIKPSILGATEKPTGSEKKIGKKYTCVTCGDHFWRAGKGKPKYCPTCKTNRLGLPVESAGESTDESIFGNEAEIDREKI